MIYAGVNPVETYIREGQYSRLPDLPYIPGSGFVSEDHPFDSNLTLRFQVLDSNPTWSSFK